MFNDCCTVSFRFVLPWQNIVIITCVVIKHNKRGQQFSTTKSTNSEIPQMETTGVPVWHHIGKCLFWQPPSACGVSCLDQKVHNSLRGSLRTGYREGKLTVCEHELARLFLTLAFNMYTQMPGC